MFGVEAYPELFAKAAALISSLITHAERHHGDGEIVSRRVEGDIHRYTWRDVAMRSRQVAKVCVNRVARVRDDDLVALLAERHDRPEHDRLPVWRDADVPPLDGDAARP